MNSIKELLRIPERKSNAAEITFIHTGVNSGHVAFNDETARGYLKAVDARSSIAITVVPSRNSEQLGYNGMSAMEHPQRQLISSGENYNAYREEGRIVVEIYNDDVVQSGYIENRVGLVSGEHSYWDKLDLTVKEALQAILVQEKMLNSERYNLSMMLSYILLLLESSYMGQEIGHTISEADPRHLVLGISFIAVVNVIANLIAISSKLGHININRDISTDTTESKMSQLARYFIVDKKDPFSRDYLYRPQDMVMPLVPVDLIALGKLYLRRHRLIEEI